MHKAQLIFAVFAFVAATACIITANTIFYKILDEVNSKLPQQQQFGFLFVNLKMFGILRKHAEFFPTSQSRKRMFIWAGVGFALMFGAFPFFPYLLAKITTFKTN